ncbi:Vesicle-mediated ER to Golgi transport protein [Massospora cicadina]|nr:Vesicle-mediated ER to Golgi transport protein [Massospora cicadina]
MAMNFLYNTFVAPDPSVNPLRRDEIVNLRCRLETEIQTSNRRLTLVELKSLASDFRQLVGEICLGALVDIRVCLEILLILFAVEDQVGTFLNPACRLEKLANKAESVASLLDCLGELDFYVRYNGIQVLQSLHASAPSRVQAALLASPVPFSRVVELLDDEREIIRNDGLLLVTAITQTNPELQKIVAFQNVFEKLLDRVRGESGLEGGIVVEDCLTLMANLLQSNASNQSYFRETSCIQRLLEPLAVTKEQVEPMEWANPQKLANVTKLLQLLALLAQPRGTHTKANQSVMGRCGVVMALVQLLGVQVLPTAVQVPTLFALGNAILDSRPNQDLVGVATLETTLEPFLVHLITIVLDRAADASARFGAAYVFQCYVSSNPEAQLALASTLRSHSEMEGRTVGSLMIGAILENSSDKLGRWLALVLFSRLLWENGPCKQLALQIHVGEEALGLLAAILQKVKDLEEGDDYWLLGGYLALLAFWVRGSSPAAGELLRNDAGLQFVIQLAHAGPDALVQGVAAFLLALLYQANLDGESHMPSSTLRTIFLKRVGAEHLLNSLARLKVSPEFRLAQPWSQLPADPLADATDYHFVEYFKAHAEPAMLLMIESPKASPVQAPPIQTPPAVDERRVALEARIQELEASEAALLEELRKLKLALEKADNYIQHLLKRVDPVNPLVHLKLDDAHATDPANPLVHLKLDDAHAADPANPLVHLKLDGTHTTDPANPLVHLKLNDAHATDPANPLVHLKLDDAHTTDPANPLVHLKLDGAHGSPPLKPVTPASSARAPPKNRRVMFPILAEAPPQESSLALTGPQPPLTHYHPPPADSVMSIPITTSPPVNLTTSSHNSCPISPVPSAPLPYVTSHPAAASPSHLESQTIFNL